MKITHLRYCKMTMAVGMLMVVLSACTLASTEKPLLPPSEGEKLWFFQEDFSGYEVGDTPSGWTVDKLGEGSIKIVSAPELASGKAISIVSDPNDGGTYVTKPFINQHLLADVTSLVIEHRFKVIEGGNHIYIMGSKLFINWTARGDENRFAYRQGGESEKQIATFQDGWNHVRLEADRVSNEVYVYLNDMDHPILGSPFTFRETMETWTGSRVRFLSLGGSNEVLHGDIKVWAEVE